MGVGVENFNEMSLCCLKHKVQVTPETCRIICLETKYCLSKCEGEARAMCFISS